MSRTRKRYYQGIYLTVTEAELLRRQLKHDIEDAELWGCPLEPDPDPKSPTVGGGTLRLFGKLSDVLTEYRKSILAAGKMPALVWDDEEEVWGEEGLAWENPWAEGGEAAEWLRRAVEESVED